MPDLERDKHVQKSSLVNRDGSYMFKRNKIAIRKRNSQRFYDTIILIKKKK